MPKQFILSSSNKTKAFICLDAQSSITILNVTLLNLSNNWQTFNANAYLEISFLYTDKKDKNKQWLRTRPLQLKMDVFQKQPTNYFNILFSNQYLTENSNTFYDELIIKLVERNEAEPVEWMIEYESNLVDEII